jgi:hypothetical protein
MTSLPLPRISGIARVSCVKILFDANTPAPLARYLRGHEVVRADELEWKERCPTRRGRKCRV